MPYEQSGMGQTGNTYQETFTRQKRGLFVFLLDQSSSMNEPVTMGKYTLTLAQMASSILNSILVAIIENAVLDTSTGRRKDYCDIIIFGYGDTVNPLLNTAGVPVPLPDLSEHYQGKRQVQLSRYDPIKGTNVTTQEEQPWWIEPYANSQRTEMAGAVDKAQQVVQDWIAADSRRIDSFPPIVINITDGRHNGARGGDPVQSATNLRRMRTNDGSVLLFNCHITKSTTQAISFPNNVGQFSILAGEDRIGAEQLFRMSSEVPSSMLTRGPQISGKPIAQGAHGFIYNASGEDLIRFLSWGTRINSEMY